MALRSSARALAFERARNTPVTSVDVCTDQYAAQVSVQPDGSIRMRAVRFTRPLLENSYHGAHHRVQANMRAEWRTAFERIAAGRFPGVDWAGVVAIPHVKDRIPQDIGACFPSVKAGIDGLVDAGILIDDGPTFLRSLKFQAVVARSPIGNALELRVTGWRMPDAELTREIPLEFVHADRSH